MTWQALDRQALKYLRDICTLLLDDKGCQAITISVPFANFKIEALKIDFETGHWQLSSGAHGNGIITLATHLLNISEAAARKKMIAMLAKAKK